MWNIALRNLLQRRLRSLLTMLGVAVAVQLYLTMASIMITYELDLDAQLNAMAGRVYVQRPTSAEVGVEEFPSPSSSIGEEMIGELLAIDGVERDASTAILYIPLTTSPAPGLPPSVIAIGIESGREDVFLGGLDVEHGTASLQQPMGVILGTRAAESYGSTDEPVEPGDTIEIVGQSFTVLGVLGKSPNLYRSVVMMELSTAQELFNRQGNVSAVILSTATTEDMAKVQTTVERSYPDLQVAGQAEIVAVMQERLESIKGFFVMINGTVIAVVFLFVSIVMFVAVLERRRDIGVLRAIGAGRLSVFGMVASESLVLSVGGALLAWPIWALVGALFVGEYASSPDVLFSGWLEMAFLAAFVGVGASLMPAWRAVQVDPLEALRYE